MLPSEERASLAAVRQPDMKVVVGDPLIGSGNHIGTAYPPGPDRVPKAATCFTQPVQGGIMTEDSFNETLLNSGPASIRLDVYAQLASLLARPPAAGRLELLPNLELAPDIPPDLGRAWSELKAAAERTGTDAAAQEYHTLFVGIGGGEVVPRASGYEEARSKGAALARLHEDLGQMNIRRSGETCQPEDHAAALCELMVLIIAEPLIPAARQAAFFAAHLATWMPRFFRDLQAAGAADFYRAVGRLGEVFMRLEGDLLRNPSDNVT
jgi:TorA maturation chaperone TorD